MVLMERYHFQGTTIHHPTAEVTGLMGFDKCRCEKWSIITLPYKNTKYCKGSLTADWLRKWHLQTPGHNPPQIQLIPASIEYLRQFALDGAYITPQQENEISKAYKSRIYDTMITLLRQTPELPVMQISRLWVNTDWATVWSNRHGTPVPEAIKMDWYRAVHDIVPTQDRLNRINMAATNLCRQCNAIDNLPHRLIECGGGQGMWDWTKGRFATILRTTMRHMLDGWLLRPTLNIWPPKRRRAVLWILAKFVAYRLQQRQMLTCHDYYEFLRRAKWKLQQATWWHERVGNYLFVITEVPPPGIVHT